MRIMFFSLFLFLSLLSFFLFSDTEKKSSDFISPPIPPNLTVKIVKKLNFGAIVPGKNKCIVKISPDTSKLIVVDGDCDIYDASSASPAVVYVYGIPYATYCIKLPSEITLFQVKGNASLKIVNISPDIHHIKKGVLDKTGKDKFQIGGSLILLPNQQPGNYSGNFSVEVYYE